ncbi:glutamate 5-kinase [Robertkochia solimangrovi]|uniref:glutamate 5-kinase n=1 Tax=Robertkochia solimangrovi TaxID=2213046 RepID=UPI00117CA8E9|nr:glutamate 5-kinase [Robertkochia solimangrovi]TRZ42541.1 glutamate 5-kinase [Robertkochia solimangrovi]
METTKKKRVVLKVGSNTLTRETNYISRGKIEDMARQIASLKDTYEFIVVSSGAIAAARQFVDLESNGKEIKVKQALAAIGQLHLMRIYQENFRELGLLVSQCLLTYSDFRSEESRKNIINTVNTLLEHDYIPVINENDTVATDEIKFGDNDKLAALTAALLQADLLIIATNTNGLYTRESMQQGIPETIAEVNDLQTILREIEDKKSSHGTGGMRSKIDAVEIAANAGIETWIVNGLKDEFLLDIISGKGGYTRFPAGVK